MAEEVIEAGQDEDGAPLVALRDSEPQEEEQAEDPAEIVNLVSHFTEAELLELGKRVCREYDQDITSCTEHMARAAKWQKLAALIREEKSWPWPDCSNVVLPLLASALMQIHARLYDMLWPADGDVFHSKPSTAGPVEMDRANRTELVLNHYVRHDMEDFEVGLDDSLWQLVLFGSMFRRTVWNQERQVIDSSWIGMDDFVVPFKDRTTSPSLRGVRRYTWVQYLSMEELEDKADRGEYENVEALRDEDGKAKGGEPKPQSEFKQATLEVTGTTPPTDEQPDDVPRQILEQYRWWQMPKRKGNDVPDVFDGKRHAVIVTLDEQTKTVLSVVVREEADPRDLRRYQREKAAFEAYEEQRDAYDARASREQELRAKTEFTADELDELAGYDQQPALRPFPVRQPAPVRKREICNFTHYKAFPSEGFYGVGFGDLVGPLNEASNTLLNQFIDGLTLQNAGGGFISSNLVGPRGIRGLRPGQLEPIAAPASAIKDGIYLHQWQTPNPAVMGVSDKLDQLGQRVVGATDLLSGEPGQTNETATTTKIRAEFALKQISVLMRRVLMYMKHEVQKIWRLLSVFLDEEDAQAVVNDEGAMVTIPVSRADFISDANVVPAADPRVSSQTERVERAMMLHGILMQHPLTQMNPLIQHASLVDVLRAHNAYDKIQLLGPPPQPPAPPPAKPAFEENAAVLKGQPIEVHPEDDHAQHMVEHTHFMNTDARGHMTPEMLMMLVQHNAHHYAEQYAKQKREELGIPQPIPGPQPGAAPGLPLSS